MPFGACVLDEGVRFRLWAPGAADVELVLGEEDGERACAMNPAGDGWFEAVRTDAGAGALYRYRIDGRLDVPDPASRFQPRDVRGPSLVVDPCDREWSDDAWRGRPFEEAVFYELHVGAFTRDGTFRGVADKLDYLADLGVTAIELMPVADFPGERNWGYDGVLPFAPDSTYGAPGDLKFLIDAAHRRGLMVFLDVVYNHFGPDGNWLGVYAPQFFTDRIATPWGQAIDFDRRPVRDFFIHNALYWLEEYRFDGLRLDAVHAIFDRSAPDILEALADAVSGRFAGERQVHLVLENDANTSRYLERAEDGRPRRYAAQWNDDVHHAMHVLATGETGGYYEDYADAPLGHLARCLTEGFAWQGEPSKHRDGNARGSPSAHLPATAFVSFLQNHDQVGNRAFGERIAALTTPAARDALTALMLPAPSPPLIFMGEEWDAPAPFPFFCDFHDELAEQVREGRRREFARFPQFRDEAQRRRIPDPNALATFESAVLDWSAAERDPHARRLARYRALLRLRHDEIVPRLHGLEGGASQYRRFGPRGLWVVWKLGDGSELELLANPGDEAIGEAPEPSGRLLFSTHGETGTALPAWCVKWYLDAGRAAP